MCHAREYHVLETGPFVVNRKQLAYDLVHISRGYCWDQLACGRWRRSFDGTLTCLNWLTLVLDFTQSSAWRELSCEGIYVRFGSSQSISCWASCDWRQFRLDYSCCCKNSVWLLATGVFLLVQHMCKWILPTPHTWIKNAHFWWILRAYWQ
jgi:hypothetical protein